MVNKGKSTKICKTCNEELDLHKFTMVKDRYYLNECRPCKTNSRREYQKIYRDAHKYDAKRKKLDKVKSEEPIERVTSSIYCNIRACSEHKGEHYGLNKYCKSHAFDKRHNVKIV